MTTTDDEPRTCERCDAQIPPARVKARTIHKKGA
jgi:RNA polymerase-binding transcription factor DksA